MSSGKVQNEHKGFYYRSDNGGIGQQTYDLSKGDGSLIPKLGKNDCILVFKDEGEAKKFQEKYPLPGAVARVRPIAEGETMRNFCFAVWNRNDFAFAHIDDSIPELVADGLLELCPECKGIPKPSVFGGGVQTGPDIRCHVCNGQLFVKTEKAKRGEQSKDKLSQMN